MKVFNTLTRTKEELIPIIEGEFKIYCCGPTVYNYIHIGNARPFCTYDLLRRYLMYKGNKVTYVQNFTDIDDKIIRKAKEEGLSVAEISQKYIDEYNIDARGLNLLKPDIEPRVTENIEQIIEFIKVLMDKGFAYEADGDVYFRTEKFEEYGKLSKMPLDDLMAGARVGINLEKENPLDFVLWKAAKDGEIKWDTPWGAGRPGWHIECSVMAKRYLGETIDIHAGGLDLIFPHHENEIAQSECANDTTFANYFMHNEFINIDNEKMAKSKGNFFTVRDVAAEYGYEAIRYLIVSSYYRSAINYSVDSIEQSRAALDRLYTFRDNLDFWAANARDGSEDVFLAELKEYQADFIAAMDNDINSAEAISVVFDLVKDINTIMAEDGLSKADLKAIAKRFDEWMNVFGLLYNRNTEAPDEEIDALIAERTKAREEKDYKKSDEIRDKLLAMGIILEDTAIGVKWSRESK